VSIYSDPGMLFGLLLQESSSLLYRRIPILLCDMNFDFSNRADRFSIHDGTPWFIHTASNFITVFGSCEFHL
jgi:hypothetical protein